MSLRRTLRILEGGLLASLAVVHLSFWLQYPAIAGAWPAYAGLIRDAVLSAQAILIAGWFVAGPGKWWWRWPVAALLAAAFVLFELIEHPRGLRWGETVLIVQACSAGLGLLVMRAIGWRMSPVERSGDEQPLRFSLRSLLAATFVVALALALGQRMRESIAEHGVSSSAIVNAVAVSLALPAAAAWPAVLSTGRPWVRTTAVLLAALPCGAVVPYLTSAPDRIVTLVSWVESQSVVVVGSLLVLRGAGYRWIRINGAARQARSQIWMPSAGNLM